MRRRQRHMAVVASVIFSLLVVLFVYGVIGYTRSYKHHASTSDKPIFCGSKAVPAQYARRGTPYECLRKGYGGGKYTERRNNRATQMTYILVAIIVTGCVAVGALAYIDHIYPEKPSEDASAKAV